MCKVLVFKTVLHTIIIPTGMSFLPSLTVASHYYEQNVLKVYVTAELLDLSCL